MKRSPLRRRSKKMRAVYEGDGVREGRRAFVERILRERPECEAGERIGTMPATFVSDIDDLDGVWLGCARLSVDVHEILARSAGGSILDEKNVLAVCRRCHDWIGNHPREAIGLGLRLSRYAGRNP